MTFTDLVTLIIIAVGLALGWQAFSRANFQPADDETQVRLFGAYSPLLTWLRYRRLPVLKQRPGLLEWLRANAGTLIELSIIAAWSIWVGRAYLDFDQFMWPMSSEIGIQINTHYFWVQAQRCGLCALWDGTINGGMPAMADPFGSKLHPLVMITTLLWGVMGGAKVALVLSFLMAGYAQWWLARLLGLGRVARLWSAMLIVVGGHLTARMATGQFATIVSTAACSLALVAAIDLALTGKRRSTLVLAITGALAIISGHSYLQLSLLSWAPAFLFFVLDVDDLRLRPIWKEYALAVGLSLLIAGIFIIPAVHFFPNFAKDTDPLFSRAQPLEYAPLNLVIRDLEFMNTTTLGKFIAPELFTIYIGWIPVLLAALSLRFARRENARIILCLITGMVMSFLMGSAIPLKWLAKLSPFFDGFRHPSLMAILVVPPIVALAAYALNELLKFNWPQLTLSFSVRTLAINSAWILVIPLYSSLSAPYELSQAFIRTVYVGDLYQFYQKVVDDLNLDSTLWVAPPFGENSLVEPALNVGLKLTNVAFPSHWNGRELPEPQVVIARSGEYPGSKRVTYLNDIPVYLYPGRAYAYIDLGDQKVPCRATGSGGDLTVTCSTGQDGQLIVQENSWVGWYAWQDEKPVSLKQGRWLAVTAPAGQHIYEFRYRPWDVAVGLAVTLIGCVLTLWLWRRAASTQPSQ